MESNIKGQDEMEVGQESTSIIIGKEIQSVRKKLNATQREVAEQIGVTASMVSKIERGLAKPSHEVAIKLRKWIDDGNKCSSSQKPFLLKCWKCKCLLPDSAFGIDKARKHGRQSKCRDCNVETVNSWRKGRWRQFLDCRKIARKLESSEKRLAGFKWVPENERIIEEIIQLVGPDVLYVRTSVWKSFPRNDGLTIPLIGGSWKETRSRNELSDKADGILETYGMGELDEVCDIPSFYEKYGSSMKELYECGRLTELQVRRIVSLTMRRLPSSFDFINR